MFCSKCGKPVKDDSLFCTFCGNPLKNEEQKSAPAEENPAPESVTAVSEPIPEAPAEPISAPKAAPITEPESVPIAAQPSAPIPESAAVTPPPVPISEPKKPAEEKYYTFGHIALCLAAVAVMAIVAGVFAGLYFSVR